MASFEELLVDAARGGNVVALDELLQEAGGGANVNLQTEGGVSLVMHAIIEAGQAAQRGGQQQHLSVVQVLIQAGCDLSLVDEQYGRSAAHWATFYHREDIFTELIIAGADLTVPDFSGISPFLLAVQENAIQCVAVAMNYCPKEMLERVDQEGRSPLLYAIHNGSVEMCRQLLELGASAEVPDQITGRTPLHWASLYSRKEVVELFCQKGCDATVLDAEGRSPVHLAASTETTDALQALNKAFGNSILEMTDMAGLTPLMYACTSNSEESIKYLLKKKVNVHAQDNDGKCCLHWSVETATPEAIICIKLLCKRFPDLMKCEDQAGRTPLLWSCAQGTAPNLATLLELGDDFTALDSDDHSGLHWATVSGNPECLLLLLQAGAHPSTPDNQGAHPLHYAAQSARDAAPPLASASFSDTIQAASTQGILDCLQLLLEAGADVDCRDQEGSTPFHWALQAPNNFTALSYLINAGADANAQNYAGLTSLHFAARHGHTENCQLLIEGVGGVTMQPDGDGQTAVFHAVEGGHVECTEYLLTIGAKAGQLNNEKRSPVHVAASVGSVECLQLLQSHGADLEQRSVHGAQPLHEAAASGQIECLEYLLLAGCSMHSRVSGGTALHYAASGGHTQCAQLLIEAGVDVNALVGTEEFEYVTALDYAEASGSEELVQLIRSSGGKSGDAVLTKATYTLQRHMRQFVKKKRKYPAAAGKTIVKKGGEESLRAGLPFVGQTAVQAAGERGELPEAATKKEIKEEEKEMEGAGEKTTVKKAEEESVAVPALREKAPTSQMTEDWKEVDEPTQSPASISKEHSKMSAKLLPRRLSQELPSDLFEVDHSPSRPASRASFPSRPISRTSPSKPVLPQSPGTEDTSERRPSVLQRVLSVFHREPHPSPLVDSAVALYGATALILAGGAVGTALGEKAIEVGEKVARKEAEGLMGQGGHGRELPELLWEEIAEEPTPISTPSVTPPVTPTPPPPEIEEDPLERRMRKAKAQLDLGHSAAFNAVNELAKTQSSGARLKREFHLKQLQDHLEEIRAGYHKQEMKAAEESLKVQTRHRQRMQQSQAASEVVNHAIGEVLSEAKDRNRQLDQTVFEMGYSRRPTVAQWLEQKKMQKQRELQEDMIQWDRDRFKRETALSVAQAVTTKRAYQHLAWAKGKDLRSRIRRLKEEEELIKAFKVLEPYSAFEKRLRTSKKSPRPVTFPKPPSAGRKTMAVGVQRLGAARLQQHSHSHAPAETSHDDVYLTPHGFAKTPSAAHQRGRSRSQPFGEERLWSYGEDVARGKQAPSVSSLKRLNRPEYIRAVGPKESPRNRSLVFVHPSQYRPSRKGTRVHPTSAQSSAKSVSESSLCIQSVEWSRPLSPRKKGTKSPSDTAQYHSLAGEINLGQHTGKSPRKKTKTHPPVKVLPMKVLESPQHPPVITT